MTLQLRTNLFQFDPDELSPVYQFEATDAYCHGWRRLSMLLNKPYLPTAGLEEILSAISGGPVWVNYRPDVKGRVPAIACANEITHEQLCTAIGMWAQETAEGGEELTQYLRPGMGLPLHASTLFADPRQSESMYKVVPWMLSQQMTHQPMESSSPLPLSLCSDASLLAWDHPLTYANEGRRAIAMHAIKTQLVLVHRRQKPYAAISVHLSHILSQWRHSTNTAWFNTGRGISKFAIHIPPMKDGRFDTQYTTIAPRVLKRMGVLELPGLGEGDIEMTGNLRPVHAHLPAYWPVGNGAGPLFLDQASFHFQRSLASARPMLARRVGKMVATAQQADDAPATTIKIAVVTAHTDTMARIVQVHDQLNDLTPVFQDGRQPHLTLQQVQRPGALQALTTLTSADHVKQWFDAEVWPIVEPMGASAAIVETIAAVATKTENDPKHILRALFAKHGVATQFLMHVPPAPDTAATVNARELQPSTTDRKTSKRLQKLAAKQQAAAEKADTTVDYPALNGLLDCIRNTGYTPQPLVQGKGVPDGTAVVSIYLEQIRSQREDEYLPVLTRAKVGSRELEVFCPPVPGGGSSMDTHSPATDGWVDYQEGLCRILACPKLMDKSEALKFINRAMLAPTPVADAPLIVLMNAGLKKIYPGLNDGAGDGLPAFPKGAWALRVRSDAQTALMTGVHSKSPSSPAYIGTIIGVHQAEHQPSVYYFTSYTKHYSRMRSQRSNTRYDIVQARLRDPWQQLGVTEFVMIQTGDFAMNDQMALQVGLWCKFAPLWDGFLRLPSPLHAARQIAVDHPVIERHRKSSF
jgi:hypothetical protein